MCALAEPHRRPRAWVLEPADAVDPRPGGVDRDARVDVDGLAVDQHLRAAHLPVGDPQGHDLGAVEHDRAGLRCRHDVLEAEPRVVRPGVGVERARAKVVGAQRRDELARARGLHQPVEAREGEGRVEEDAALDERGPERPTAIEREQEREAMHEVRRDGPGQRAPLVVRLADEPHVSEAQVAQATVDELRRRARRARAEVPRVDERDREPGAGGVRGGRRADHAASDHEQVERRSLERVARGGPARCARDRLRP